MQKRVFSISLALFFLFQLLFSVTYFGTQAGHEHLDESDCLICQQMQDCSERLHMPTACPNTEKTTRNFVPTRKISSSRRSSILRSGAYSPVSFKDKLTN